MYSSLAEEGVLAPFFTANWVCPTWPNLAAGVALLLTAGGAAERTLGHSRFASIYVLAGVSAHVWYYGLSFPGDPAAYQCGVAGGLVRERGAARLGAAVTALALAGLKAPGSSVCVLAAGNSSRWQRPGRRSQMQAGGSKQLTLPTPCVFWSLCF